MKIYNGLIRIFRKAKFDQLSQKSFDHWKEIGESFYEGEETIWKQFCRIEFLNPSSNFEEFCKDAKTTFKERKQKKITSKIF